MSVLLTILLKPMVVKVQPITGIYQAMSAQGGIHSGIKFNDIIFTVAEDLSPPVLAITVHTPFLSLSKIGIAGDHPHSC